MDKKTTVKDKKGEHPFGDAGQLILLLVFLFVWVSDSFFLRKTTFLAVDIPLYIRLPLFGLLFVLVIVLIRGSHFIIESDWRPDYVVKKGVYKYIRHPMYLASILTYLGLTISTASIASFIILVVIFIFHNYIASYEERILVNKFGKAYKDYMNETGRWIPRFHRSN